MDYFDFDNVGDFLAVTGDFLASDEVVNGLMLGVAERLRKNALYYGTRPYFGLVKKDDGLILVALMTPPHRLLLLSPCADCPREAVSDVAQALCRGRWPVSGVLAREDVARGFAGEWRGLNGLVPLAGMRQRVHELRRVNPIDFPPGDFHRAEEGDIDLVVRWALLFHDECFRTHAVVPPDKSEQEIRAAVRAGGVFFWRKDEPVSMAARVRPTARGESISWVFTPQAERRRGYARSVVARLAALILSGVKDFCSLNTDLANPTSNKIYREIVFMPRADVVEIDFRRSGGGGAGRSGA